MAREILWLEEPEQHDFDAARDFLSLLTADAEDLVQQLDCGEEVTRKAKDLLRAVGDDGNPLSALLPLGNEHVGHTMDKIHDNEPLSPVLLVVDTQRARLIIADGHHRVSACYHADENAEVHARLIYW